MTSQDGHSGGLSFPGREPGHPFFSGGTQDEALARLGYIVESGRRCATVTGAVGIGKSTLLQVFAEDCRAAHHGANLLDVTDFTALDALQNLAAALGVTLRKEGSVSRVWQEIGDALVGRQQNRRRCVILFDHLDRSRPDCRQVVQRLLARSRGMEETVLVLAFSGSAGVVPREWRQASELRIELEPLTAEETREFAQILLEDAALPKGALDAGGGEALFRLTQGVPREIVRLCEFAMLSAMHDETAQISADAVEAAMSELRSLRASA